MKKIVHFFLFVCIIVPHVMFAAGEITPGSGQTTTTIKPVINNPLNQSLSSGGIPGIINAVMRGVVMPLASILVVLAILYSGFKFVMAQGNATEIQKAREGLVWVLIGSAVLLGAYGISEFIQGTINQIVTTSV
jgi:hypothetical protein